MDDLEDIMLCEISQAEKEISCISHLHTESKKVKYTEARGKWWFPGAGAGETGDAGQTEQLRLRRMGMSTDLIHSIIHYS